MPEEPKYRLGVNDIFDAGFWTEDNLQTLINGLNSLLAPLSLIKQERLDVVDIPIPLIDGGNLDLQ